MSRMCVIFFHFVFLLCVLLFFIIFFYYVFISYFYILLCVFILLLFTWWKAQAQHPRAQTAIPLQLGLSVCSHQAQNATCMKPCTYVIHIHPSTSHTRFHPYPLHCRPLTMPFHFTCMSLLLSLHACKPASHMGCLPRPYWLSSSPLPLQKSKIPSHKSLAHQTLFKRGTVYCLAKKGAITPSPWFLQRGPETKGPIQK